MGRGEALAVFAADEGLGGGFVVRKGEAGFIPKQFAVRDVAGFDGEESGLGHAQGILEGSAEFGFFTKAVVHPRMPVIEFWELGQAGHFKPLGELAIAPDLDEASGTHGKDAIFTDDDGHISIGEISGRKADSGA